MIAIMLAATLALQGEAVIPESLRNVAWTPLGDDGGVLVFLDSASPRRTGDTVRFRVRATGEPQGDGMRTMLIDMAYDCAARTATVWGVRRFDGAGRPLPGGGDVPAEQRQAQALNLEIPIEAATYARLCGAAR